MVRFSRQARKNAFISGSATDITLLLKGGFHTGLLVIGVIFAKPLLLTGIVIQVPDDVTNGKATIWPDLPDLEIGTVIGFGGL